MPKQTKPPNHSKFEDISAPRTQKSKSGISQQPAVRNYQIINTRISALSLTELWQKHVDKHLPLLIKLVKGPKWIVQPI